MSPETIILVVISACMHAGWNLLGKRHSPSPAFFMLCTLAGVILLLPWLFWAAPYLPEWRSPFWFWLLMSGLCQALYLTGLARAYASGDMSIAYPLARALPVAMVPLLYLFWQADSAFDASHWGAVVLIMAGALLLPVVHLSDWNWRAYTQPSILYILLAAVATTGYSLIDSYGVALLKEQEQLSAWYAGMTYLLLQGIASLTWLLPWIFCQRVQRKETQRLLQTPGQLFMVGFFLNFTYLLILISFSMAEEVSFVVALRQISIPIGVMACVIWLREQVTVTRIIATAMMFAGTVLVSL